MIDTPPPPPADRVPPARRLFSSGRIRGNVIIHRFEWHDGRAFDRTIVHTMPSPGDSLARAHMASGCADVERLDLETAP